jgi:hypothetical protein
MRYAWTSYISMYGKDTSQFIEELILGREAQQRKKVMEYIPCLLFSLC